MSRPPLRHTMRLPRRTGCARAHIRYAPARARARGTVRTPTVGRQRTRERQHLAGRLRSNLASATAATAGSSLACVEISEPDSSRHRQPFGLAAALRNPRTGPPFTREPRSTFAMQPSPRQTADQAPGLSLLELAKLGHDLRAAYDQVLREAAPENQRQLLRALADRLNEPPVTSVSPRRSPAKQQFGGWPTDGGFARC
jgi:hypothetical protein